MVKHPIAECLHPAGMMLGLLLARAGVEVVVLEKRADFLRDFRGDTIHPSTLEVLSELGLLVRFLALPHQKVSRINGQFGDLSLTVADFSTLRTQCRFVAFIPQWDFLAFLAQSPRYFTYYEAAQQRGAELHVVLGDARVKLAEAPDHRYDLIVLDAFSSDAIPVHLITREALTMYLSKLTDDGVVALHISNRYLGLEPVLGNLAKDLSLVGLKQFDDESDKKHPGKSSSDWALLARRQEALGSLVNDSRWIPLKQDDRVGVWTDDFSNVLRVFDWTSRH